MSSTFPVSRSIIEARDTVKKQNDRTYEVLEKLSKRAGYPTVDEYIDKALSHLSKEDLEKYQQMQKNITSEYKITGLTIQITGAVAGISFGARVAGNIRGGAQMLMGAFRTLKNVAGAEAPLGARAARVLRVFKMAASALAIIGAIAEVGLLIYDAARRFCVKKSQLLADVSLSWCAMLTGIVSTEDALDELVVDGTLTKGKKDAEVNEKITQNIERFQGDHEAIKDGIVWEKLSVQDAAAGAWRNEDPDLEAVKKMD
ncbi:hypothetical protein K440DRAFT_640889 [Wilcoxina mikolae CBS 423.85]|nr:hypothetical protein K440DRAFT_640889 [Wilcoxina mikolae CBS 423.85]